MRPIQEVAGDLGLRPKDLIMLGPDKAKVQLSALQPRAHQGRLILVTAMSPNLAGEGKTTVAIGLVDALRQLGVKASVALRQPSMGPVFGRKGGAAGAGRAELVPAASINLHFTGDFHAITQAHNLLCSAIDNSLHHGNPLDINPTTVSWPRVLDLNERALRKVVVGLGGVVRESGFVITAASEIMAILALSRNWGELRQNLGRIIVARNREGQPITAEQLKVAGALGVLLRDALLPNLVQTAEGSPALVHCGPFANIAHGTSSLVASLLALQGSELVLQEAGFGADLGGEKFLDLFCPQLGTYPSLAVLVITSAGIRSHGLENVIHQLERLDRFALPSVVCLNVHSEDSDDFRRDTLRALRDGGRAAFECEVFTRGGAGARELAEYIRGFPGGPARVRPIYHPEQPLRHKIEAVATGVYGASGIELSASARRQMEDIERIHPHPLYVCIAKTQYSLSDDPKKTGVCTGLPLRISEVQLRAGAGFVVPIAGDMMIMPALPSRPNYEEMELFPDGSIRLTASQ